MIPRQDHNPLQESLEKLDLKGLLVLNGLIVQQALKLILDAEVTTNKLSSPLLLPDKKILK